MRLVRLRRRYRRTCNVCGGSWVVDRAVAGRPPRRRSTRAGVIADPRRAGLSAGAAGLEASWRAVLDRWEQFRRCPTCGHDDFWQEADRSRRLPSGSGELR